VWKKTERIACRGASSGGGRPDREKKKKKSEESQPRTRASTDLVNLTADSVVKKRKKKQQKFRRELLNPRSERSIQNVLEKKRNIRDKRVLSGILNEEQPKGGLF